MISFLQHIGTFEGVSSTVRSTMVDALIQLLTPKRRIDILRDVQEAKANGRPYSITFCGVNGVGKSTNLAKVLHLDISLFSVIYAKIFFRKSFKPCKN